MPVVARERCWDGCGKNVAPGSKFTPGHDVYAALAIAKLHYGSIQNMVKKHGYGPSVKDFSLQVTYEQMKDQKRANHKRTSINSHGSRRRSFQRTRRQNSNVG